MSADNSRDNLGASSKTVTLPKKEIEKTLRLVLKSADKILAPKITSRWTNFEIPKRLKFLGKDDLENENNPNVYIEKIENEFKRIHEMISNTKEFVKNEMRTMNTQEREEVIIFWSEVAEFFTKLMDTLNEWFNSICLELKTGKKINKNALNETFDEINNTIIKIFNRELLLADDQIKDSKKKELQENRDDNLNLM